MSSAHVLLLLSLALQISGEQLFVVRSGTTVTLPCGRESPTNCTWTQAGDVLKTRTRTKTRRSSMDGLTLEPEILHVERVPGISFLSKVGDGTTLVFPASRSHRLNLTESCELQIQDVKTSDAGVYVCDQLDQSQSSSELDQSQRSESFLSVVSFSSQDLCRKTSLSCDVSPYGGRGNCGFMVKLLVQPSDQDRLTFRTSQCLAEVTYPNGSSSPSLSCEVTDLNHNQVFVLQSPGSQWNQTESGLEEPQDSVVPLLMLVMRSVELLMASVVMVILLRGK